MTRPEYLKLVEKGKALVGEQINLQWRFGDLGKEVLPEAKATNRDAYETLRNYYIEIGLEEAGVAWATFKRWRTCAIAWPTNRRRAGSWTAHNSLSPHPDRFELWPAGTTLTLSQAKKLAGHQIVTASEIQQNVDRLDELVCNEDVRTAVVAEAEAMGADTGLALAVQTLAAEVRAADVGEPEERQIMKALEGYLLLSSRLHDQRILAEKTLEDVRYLDLSGAGLKQDVIETAEFIRAQAEYIIEWAEAGGDPLEEQLQELLAAS